MKTKKVSRHYCDFCKKGMFHKSRMEKHEKGCTLNPNRVCGMCAFAGQFQALRVVLDQFMRKFDESIETCAFGEAERIAKTAQVELLALVQNCPACYLAAWRPYKNGSWLYRKWKEDAEKFLGNHSERPIYG